MAANFVVSVRMNRGACGFRAVLAVT